MSKQVCVYCASSQQIAFKYFEHTREITESIVRSGHHIIYGGGASGLMGEVADTAIQHNGRIVGVMPHFMKQVEWNHPGVTEMIYVDTMAARKERMIEGTDVFLALPGGTGTLEEIIEVITLKRLGQTSASIIFYNQDGYYNAMHEMISRCVSEKFMSPSHLSMIHFVDNQADLMALVNAKAETMIDINSAVVR